MIWIAVFPTLTALNLVLGEWLGRLDPVLRTFVLATVAVPIVIYGLMPQLHRLRVRPQSRHPLSPRRSAAIGCVHRPTRLARTGGKPPSPWKIWRRDGARSLLVASFHCAEVARVTRMRSEICRADAGSGGEAMGDSIQSDRDGPARGLRVQPPGTRRSR